MTTEVHRSIDAVFRMEQAKLIAGLARVVRDVGIAEELSQDALVAALKTWPETGIPRNPGAWLMAAAKHRAIDHFRRRKLIEKKHEELGREIELEETPDIDAALDDHIGDDLLRLIFTSCHSLLPTESRVALTLRLVGGLTTEEIARAFLVPEATIAQRIVRAKRALSEAGVPFEVPAGPELAERLASVLEVIYLVFNEGYAATAGEDWVRPELCNEALRLGRILIQLAPQEGETYGLLALMELNASRIAARTDSQGDPVLLMDQNRALWDHLQISRGLRSLARAHELGGAGGFYTLQAEIVACHARASGPDNTDWRTIARLYQKLTALVASPVIELNRAVAVGMVDGPVAALAIVDGLAGEPSLKSYHLLPTVRGDLLQRLGRFDEARAAFEAAATLAGNAREREMLKRRAAEAASAARRPPNT